jgi:hypothetical protein
MFIRTCMSSTLYSVSQTVDECVHLHDGSTVNIEEMQLYLRVSVGVNDMFYLKCKSVKSRRRYMYVTYLGLCMSLRFFGKV